MLWLGLVARDTGHRASQILKIRDEADALSFDLAVSLRLLRYDNEREHNNRRFWVQLVTGEDIGDDSILDSPTLNDPYADGNTMVW